MAKDLLLLGLTNNPDGTKNLLTLGLGSASEPPTLDPPGQILLKNEANIYVSKVAEGEASSVNTIRLNVKDFSYNRTTNTSLAQRNTLNKTQERTVSPYVEAISPVNFTLTTYVLPMKDGGLVTSPEEYLWISLMGKDIITNTSINSAIDFSNFELMKYL